MAKTKGGSSVLKSAAETGAGVQQSADIAPGDPWRILEALDQWMAEDGVRTGARFVRHMEYDSNWHHPYRVVLCEWPDQPAREPREFIGESAACLPDAIGLALTKARRGW
jgi:hypothetical protein